MEKDKCSNYIIAVFQTNEDNETIRIINSYEESRRANKWIDDKEEYHNEKEIKENCEIIINNEIIPFSYKHKFNKKGQYKIMYIFKKIITNINHLFCDVKCLVKLDLSNFKANNVTNMHSMFSRCPSLINPT